MRRFLDGSLDLAAPPQGGVKHYYVEQAYGERLPIDSAQISYEYLKNLKV